jgi:hypothetical protein
LPGWRMEDRVNRDIQWLDPLQEHGLRIVAQ